MKFNNLLVRITCVSSILAFSLIKQFDNTNIVVEAITNTTENTDTSEIVVDKSIKIKPYKEINNSFYKTASKKDERLRKIEELREKEIKLYQKNNSKLKEDANKGEILLENFDDMEVYRDMISLSMSEEYDIEPYDVVYVNGVGNSLSSGEGKSTYECDGLGHVSAVVIDIKDNALYKYAVVRINHETQELEDFLGWYMDDSVLSRKENYALVKERPISKELIEVPEDSLDYSSCVDDGILYFPDGTMFPEIYTAIDDTYNYGIDVDFAEEVPTGYKVQQVFPNFVISNVFIVPEELYDDYGYTGGMYSAKTKYYCNHELVNKKYFKK